MRSSAKPSPPETQGKVNGSDNGCYISWPNRIQNQQIEDLAGLPAEVRHSIEARFWSKVNKTDSCWLWTGSRTGRRRMHGQFHLAKIDGRPRNIYPHRFSWMLAYGSIPNTLQVLHRCDVGICVRPEHLFLGTQDDNLKDAARKGRFHVPHTITLSLADRLAIYYMPARRGIGVELALRYGVTEACISTIRRGKFVGAPDQAARAMAQVFERVPHVLLPVRGEVA